MPPHNRRQAWHQVKGKWTRSLGERGCRVRLFQKRRNGTYYREVWLQGVGRDRKCLCTKEQAVAEELGRGLMAHLLKGEIPKQDSKVTLQDVWDRYESECPSFLDNKPASRKDYAARATDLIAFYGGQCDVRTLTERDQAAYVARRTAGGIVRPNGTKSVPVRIRSVEADLAILHIMLRWATTVRLPDGSRWLERNPLEGIPRPREKNPVRPVATAERFERTRGELKKLAASSKSDTERNRWRRIELALVIVEATGRRLSAVRRLRWEDVDLEKQYIRWRAEADKRGREWLVPMTPSLTEAIRGFRNRLGVLGGWIFAAEKNPGQPMDRHLFDKWLSLAERTAKLPKLKGGMWHPYRRKWATERQHHPLKAVAEAGGWKDLETLQVCYQHPDRDALLAVMSEPRKLRDAAVMG